MEDHESNLGKDGGGAGGCMGGRNSDPFIDRSKVRILLCDNDMKSCEDVFELLCKCSYQVTSVKSARQVIDALNAEGPDIDIILSEVDLPMKKGMKMLKYIMCHEDLKRIPVIMMSTQDEVSTVVKCLRLGAADYLVKPLRSNELLNLWTHMWRRRHMLGLAEKNIISYDFDLATSDPSDANTNSTALFSDETDDKSRKNVNPDICLPTVQEVEVNGENPSNNGPNIQIASDPQAGQLSSYPKKCELKIGESSAFFTYVKSSMLKNVPARSFSLGVAAPDENSSQPSWAPVVTTKSKIDQAKNASNGHQNREASRNDSPGDEFPSSTSFPDSTSMERSCTPPISMELSKYGDEDLSQSQIHPSHGTHVDNTVFNVHPSNYPYYMSQMMVASPHHMYQNNVLDGQQNHPASSLSSAIIPQYNNHHHSIQQCPSHMPGMQPFPFFHMGLCLQPQQMPSTTAQQWYPSLAHSSATNEATPAGKVTKREAALMKFRQKRKERCFDKKIRYINRKRLAERRPRVKGQFVRKVNGVNVDLNGDPSLGELEDVDEEEDDNDEDADTCLRGSSLDDVCNFL